MEITWRVITGEREGKKEGGEVKNSIGNREAKELTCTTHGQELKVGGCRGEGG